MRAPLIAVLTIVILSAGCASAPTAKPAAKPSVAVVTAVNDVASLENMTFNNESHFHDYWGGADHLAVMDAKVPAQTFFFSPDWFVLFRPDSGHVVPQGTSKLVVTLSWTDASTDKYDSPELWVQTPAQSKSQKVAGIQQGVPLTFTANGADADTPHQQLSAWRFEFHLHPAQPEGLIWYQGDVSIKVEAYRGLEIPLFPPHPDNWKGKEKLSLLDEQQSPSGVWIGNAEGAYNCFGDCPVIHRPANGSLVPWDAAQVEVRLEPGSDAVTGIGLKVHGADSRNWTEVQPATTEGAAKIYKIRVTPIMGDGPYASQSQWEFLPFIDGPQKDSIHEGSYHISAWAEKFVS